MAPILSVVIPFFNVQSYIAECLESVANQSIPNIEVILIDDGSMDASTRIACDFARRDRRFVIHRQDNAGLGLARNAGALRATGRYLAFVDSDDKVTSDGYHELVSALERTGSDFAAGGAYRLTPQGVVPYQGFGTTFGRTRLRTHIEAFPSLVHDRMIWNKVFRRSFWCQADLSFPRGLYEDAVVALGAHCRSQTVDVLGRPVYYWRYRETGDSITQRRYELGNLLARARMVADAGRVVAGYSESVKWAYDMAMCSGYDLRLLALALTHDPNSQPMKRVRGTLAEYLSTVNPQIVEGLDEPHRTRIQKLAFPSA